MIREYTYDRIFWIYFIITLFFIIIGLRLIISSNDPYMLVISFFWLIGNLSLLIITYHASIIWGPTDENNGLICVADQNSKCFEPTNRTWLLINIVFVLLLIISVLWAGELSNTDAGPLKSISGVLILLGGLILCTYSKSNVIPFSFSVGYLLIWLSLTFYIILQ